MINYKEFKQVSKVIFNDIRFDDFVDAGNQMDYTPDYIETCWHRFIKDQIGFLANHDMGELIFSMALNKMQVDKLINP